MLEAVALAERNRQRLHLTNATVLNSHWFSALQGQRFDLIISNPPYIADNDPHLVAGDVLNRPVRWWRGTMAWTICASSLKVSCSPERRRLAVARTRLRPGPGRARFVTSNQGFDGVIVASTSAVTNASIGAPPVLTDQVQEIFEIGIVKFVNHLGISKKLIQQSSHPETAL